MNAPELKTWQDTVRRLQRNQRLLSFLLVGLAALCLVGAGSPNAQPGKKSLEVSDDQGRVRVRIEVGKIALFNSKGEEKARLTADENNGNLVVLGAGKKRLEIFMDPQTPRVVFYEPGGAPTMVLPPHQGN